MGLQDIVDLQITLRSSAPTKAGFGRPMIVGYHENFPEYSRLYKNADDMLDDGFTEDDQLYKLAVKVKSQRPCPKDFKIGRLATAQTQIIELSPTVTTVGFVYSGKIDGNSFSYTVLTGDDLAEICTAVASAITALAGVSAVGAATKVTVTNDTPGEIFQYTELVPELSVFDATQESSLATNLGLIHTEDSDWFGLLLASNSEDEVAAAAEWIETKRKMLVFTTADFGAKDPGTTTDIMSDLQDGDYFNTGGFYHHEINSGMAAAIMAQRFTATPGSDTWAHKSVSGVGTTGKHANKSAYLTTAQEAAVQAKNGNTYTEIAGNGNTFPGKVGGGDFFDAVRYIHFLFARIQEAVIGVFQANAKIPYTDAGVDSLVGVIMAVLAGHTKAPFNALSLDPAPFVSAPKVADVSQADKANRLLPDVSFGATYTGAIHAVEISGTVSV